MPFSSARSVRAPASKATSTVVARVPPISMRWMGSPEGSDEDSIRAIPLSCQRRPVVPAPLDVEHVVPVHEDRVAAGVLDLAEAVRMAAVGRQLGGDVLQRPTRLQVSSVDQLNAYPCVVWHGVSRCKV